MSGRRPLDGHGHAFGNDACLVRARDLWGLPVGLWLCGYIDCVCESPIEGDLAVAVISMESPEGERIWLHQAEATAEQAVAWHKEDGKPYTCWPQALLGNYRVDFLFLASDADGAIRRFVVECDGHDFHEKTKAQAMRNRRRDRWLTSSGFVVLRFTGSEIYRDLLACRDELGRVLFNSGREG